MGWNGEAVEERKEMKESKRACLRGLRWLNAPWRPCPLRPSTWCVLLWCVRAYVHVVCGVLPCVLWLLSSFVLYRRVFWELAWKGCCFDLLASLV